MSYTDYEEITIRYPILKTWGKTAPEVNSDLIYYAEMELNGLMATHFSVPFSESHPTVKDLAMDLAYYKAILTKEPLKAKDIHDAILGRIDRIKEGKEFIFTGSNTTIQPNAVGVTIWSNVMSYHPVHTLLDADSEYTYVSSARLADLESERD